MTRGRGVSIHRTDCEIGASLARGHGERLIDVTWDDHSTGTFSVVVELKALDRSRLLQDVTHMLSDQQVNIVSCLTSTGPDRVSKMRFEFELGDPSHLEAILSGLRRIDSVYDAYRVLPGGGIDEGESPREAARRELAEESGYVVDDADLHGPLATRVVLHGYSDQVTEQAEEFFLVRVEDPYDVDVSGHTAFERESVQGHAWRAVGETAAHPVWPLELATLVALAGQPELWPVDLGQVEESPVPISLGHR